MSDLIDRIQQFLDAAAAPLQESVVEAKDEVGERVRAALSGAFGEAITVSAGDGDDAGAYFAYVPVRHLRASGLKFVESVARARVAGRDAGGIVRVLTGNPTAVANATNRVGKPLGEAFRVSLDSFACHVGADDEVVFRVDQA